MLHKCKNKRRYSYNLVWSFEITKIDGGIHPVACGSVFRRLIAYKCYRNASLLFFGKHTISSEVGCQQEDPCGPLAFSLTAHPIVKMWTIELNLWFMDDSCLTALGVLLENFKSLIEGNVI